MASFSFELAGTTPLLMHQDSIDGADIVKAWRDDPQNKGMQRPGDDRSPAWGWIYCLYLDGDGKICIPSANLATGLMLAGGYLSAGKGRTMKRSAAAGLFIPDEFLTLLVDGKEIDGSQFFDKLDESDFDGYRARCSKLGFELWAKRAKVGQSKHIRVRPRFNSWAVRGRIETILPEFTEEIVGQLFDITGKRIGLGDWRVGSPKSPGPFGQFAAKIKASK